MWIFRELREAHNRTTARWPAAPWMLARAFAKHVKDSKGGVATVESFVRYAHLSGEFRVCRWNAYDA